MTIRALKKCSGSGCSSRGPEQNNQPEQSGGHCFCGLQNVLRSESAQVGLVNLSRIKVQLNQWLRRFAQVLRLAPLKGTNQLEQISLFLGREAFHVQA